MGIFLGKNGAGDSSNIPLTIPAGTDHLTVFVDEQRGIAYDSVRTAPMNIYQNAGSVTSPAFETTVSLIGTVRQSGMMTGMQRRKATNSHRSRTACTVISRPLTPDLISTKRYLIINTGTNHSAGKQVSGYNGGRNECHICL